MQMKATQQLAEAMSLQTAIFNLMKATEDQF